MKIVDMRVRCVAIPMNCMLRHNTGVHPGYLLRTILELITDEGIVQVSSVLPKHWKKVTVTGVGPEKKTFERGG